MTSARVSLANSASMIGIQFRAIFEADRVAGKPIRRHRRVKYIAAKAHPFALVLDAEEHRAIGALVRAVGHDHVVAQPGARRHLARSHARRTSAASSTR